MFCPQPQMLYVCFCALNHFNLYICLKRSFWLSLYLCGFEGTCEGGITPPISALITPTTDPSNHCLGVGRSCSLVGGILSGSPTIVSILDLLHLASITISENAERCKRTKTQKSRNTKNARIKQCKAQQQQQLFPPELNYWPSNTVLCLLSQWITKIVKNWSTTAPYDIRHPSCLALISFWCTEPGSKKKVHSYEVPAFCLMLPLFSGHLLRIRISLDKVLGGRQKGF